MNYTCENRNSTGTVYLNVVEPEKDITLLNVEIHFEKPCAPKPVIIRWQEACVDICAALRSNSSFERTLGPNWNKKRNPSRLASCAPIYSWISNSSENRLTVAISDAETPTEISGGVIEENGMITCGVSFFTQPINPITTYRTTIRLDRRKVRYEDALRAADRFWVEQGGYSYAYVPQAAREAVYSCWYSFHQMIDVPAIVEQCRLAREYGMKTVIVDDGWQTDDVSRGYAQCGNWQVAPGKIADMRKFVDEIHNLDMKFVLWYSVPFIGKQTEAFGRFHDMTLGSIGMEWEALDPRYPEVRDYLIGLYAKAVDDWDLDGFKLDFIDSFGLNPNTKTFDPRWDTLSLEEGVDKLLSGISKTLRALKPDILIEFRQTYFGPAIRKYGNMIRVNDCPDDPLKNRVNSVDLRYFLGKVPVHSDMLMWHSNDKPEAVAYQMIATLFCVPQISVMLDKIPETHRNVLKFYLDFWQKHRKTLLDSDLHADHPETLYSQVRAESDEEMIAVAYSDPVLKAGFHKPTALINATGNSSLYLQNEGAPRPCTIVIHDCTGHVISQQKYTLSTGVHAFEVPNSGMLEVN